MIWLKKIEENNGWRLDLMMGHDAKLLFTGKTPTRELTSITYPTRMQANFAIRNNDIRWRPA